MTSPDAWMAAFAAAIHRWSESWALFSSWRVVCTWRREKVPESKSANRLGGRRDWLLEVTEMELMRSCNWPIDSRDSMDISVASNLCGLEICCWRRSSWVLTPQTVLWESNWVQSEFQELYHTHSCMTDIPDSNAMRWSYPWKLTIAPRYGDEQLKD